MSYAEPGAATLEESFFDKPSDISPRAGFYPSDVDAFDFTHPEDEHRALLYGRGDCFSAITKDPAALTDVLESMEDRSNVADLATPYLKDIDPELHPALLSWMGQKLTSVADGGSESVLA